MTEQLEVKLIVLRRLYKDKLINETAYTDAVMKVIGVKQ